MTLDPPGPRALIHCSRLGIGGAEASLVRLTRLLCERGWAVDLVFEAAGGELEPRLDPRIRKLPLRSTRVCEPQRGLGKNLATARGPAGKARVLVGHMFYRLRRLGLLRRRYDVAMVGKTSLPPRLVCCEARARRRWVWVRTDLSRLVEDSPVIRCVTRYSDMVDQFLCVSSRVRDSLAGRFPELASRARVVHNVLDAEEMRRRAREPAPPPPGTDGLPRLVTVCRLDDSSKGVYRMLEVHRRLREEGLDFHWDVVGTGPDGPELARRVEEQGLGDRFHLLGPRPNALPDLVRADVVVVPSLREGLSGVINEAKVLGRPVVATRVGGVADQLVDGESGLIVESDVPSMVTGIRRVLEEPGLREHLGRHGLPAALLDDPAKEASLRELLG